ncbi:hypothetical protein [Paenibacillus glycanilyticus]|uniref:hypothetical protein n=1 Tax=Paenibacillus glycanilyticus TaxID=126569 RepID=UPI003EBE874E
MKRIKVVFVLAILLILGACSKDDSISEWIRVANMTERPVEFSIVSDSDQINKLNKITGGLKWEYGKMGDANDSNYQFWLERKGEVLRITNFELWINEDSPSAVIADYIQFKVATISGDDLKQLIQILDSGHSGNEER